MPLCLFDLQYVKLPLLSPSHCLLWLSGIQFLSFFLCSSASLHCFLYNSSFCLSVFSLSTSMRASMYIYIGVHVFVLNICGVYLPVFFEGLLSAQPLVFIDIRDFSLFFVCFASLTFRIRTLSLSYITVPASCSFSPYINTCIYPSVSPTPSCTPFV